MKRVMGLSIALIAIGYSQLVAMQPGPNLTLLTRSLIQDVLAQQPVAARKADVSSIDSSNVYRLGESTDQGIAVNASDVVVDFNGFNINLQGITVAPNMERVVLMNGVIDGTLGSAITIGEGAKNVVMRNMTFLNCGNALNAPVIDIVGDSSNPARNITIVQTDLSLNKKGLRAVNADNVALFNVRLSNIDDPQFEGLNFTDCTNVGLVNCVVAKCAVTDAALHGAMSFSGINGLYLEDLLVQNFSNSTGAAAGILLDNCSCFLINRCKVCGVDAPSSTASGVVINDSTDGLVVQSESDSNKTASFELTGNSENVVLFANYAANSSVGFSNNGQPGNVFSKNTARDNTTNYSGVTNVSLAGDAMNTVTKGANLSE